MSGKEQLPVVRVVQEETCIRLYLRQPEVKSGPIPSPMQARGELFAFLRKHGVNKCVLDLDSMGGGA